MEILVKLTSRKRPNELLYCIDKAIEMAYEPEKLKWLITLDNDDELCNNKEFMSELHKRISNPVINLGNSKSKIEAINADINDYKLSWDILVNLSDDQIAETKYWDKIIKGVMSESLDCSLWFYDGWQDRINTMEIVGYNYYKRFNYIYYPEYKSFYCDNETTEIAEKLNRSIKSNTCLFRHYHYGWNPNSHMKKDETYTKAEAYWNHDQELFKKRKLINYGL
jgi:hypothetical protein